MKIGKTQMDQVFRALGDQHRLQILDLLMEREQNAGELLQQVDVVQSTLSHHMKSLCESGLVRARKSGKWTYYSVDNAVVELAREFLRKYLQEQMEELTLSKETDGESGKQREAIENSEQPKQESGSECCQGEPRKAEAKESEKQEAEKAEREPESCQGEPRKAETKEKESEKLESEKAEREPECCQDEPLKKKAKEKRAFGKKNGEKKESGKKKEKGKKGEKKKEKKNRKKAGESKKDRRSEGNRKEAGGGDSRKDGQAGKTGKKSSEEN